MVDDGQDVQARLKDSLARAAARAYEAAHGNPIPTEARGLRWRLEPRVAAIIAGALLFAVAIALMAPRGASEATPLAVVTVSSADGPSAQVVVHITGAVASPGVVTLDEGSRVEDAVGAAGGFTPEADESSINLARILVDGEQVYVSQVGEAGDGRVNVNRADAEALDSLPGVGPVLAARIVADRTANGPFSSLSDLARVDGIGEAVLGEIAALATV